MLKYRYEVELGTELLTLIDNIAGEYLPAKDREQLQAAIADGGPVSVKVDYNLVANPATTLKLMAAKTAIQNIISAVKAELPVIAGAAKALARDSKITVVSKLPGEEADTQVVFDGAALGAEEEDAA